MNRIFEAIQEKNCSIAIEARPGGGKTTLAKAFLCNIPLKTLVFVPTHEVMKEYRGFPVERAYKTLNKKRFEHYISRMREKNVIFEDIPMWIKDDKDEEALDYIMGNIISGIRKRKHLIIATTYDFGRLPRRTLWSFSFYVMLRGGTWHLARLASRGIPNYVCWFLQNLRRNIPEYHYSVLDTIQNRITKPVENGNINPLLNCLLGLPTDAWIFDEIVPENRTAEGQRGRPKMPEGWLNPTAQKIINALKDDPHKNLNELATELPMKYNTLRMWIVRLKKSGHLDSNVRYGSL
jgi:hypothetical protein